RSPCSSLCAVTVFRHAAASTELYTLSLHDALPILKAIPRELLNFDACRLVAGMPASSHAFWNRGDLSVRSLAVMRFLSSSIARIDRKSTRLNSSHVKISYAVFCLKKKKPLTLMYAM